VQASRTGAFAGRRARLTARVKTQDASGWAGLLLRAEDKNGTIIALDNMKTRQITGTTGWQSYAVVLDIPPTAIVLVYGLSLAGTGAAWLDDVKLEAVGSDVEVTWAVSYEMPKRPVESFLIRPAPENLSLESWSAPPAPSSEAAVINSSAPVTRAIHMEGPVAKPRKLD